MASIKLFKSNNIESNLKIFTFNLKLNICLERSAVAGPLRVLELCELAGLGAPAQCERAQRVVGVLHLAHYAHPRLTVLLLSTRPAKSIQ